MRIGVFVQTPTLDEFVSTSQGVADAGFPSVWTPQIFGLDALTAIAVAGREVQGVDFGTAVIPTYPRHPLMLAAQALTTQMATGGRLTLGIGLSHQVVIENMFGFSFDKPARHMREYLSALMPLLHDRRAGFKGETLTAMGALQIPGAEAPKVLVAALGSVMLKLAGTIADGTVTWMTGPKTVGDHVAPRIIAAAKDADRPEPAVVVALPVAVADDPAGAREVAAKAFQTYGHLPSYRAMLDREGAEGPADVAIVGDATSVKDQIQRVFDSGATEFVAVPFLERERTLAAVAELL